MSDVIQLSLNAFELMGQQNDQSTEASSADHLSLDGPTTQFHTDQPLPDVQTLDS